MEKKEETNISMQIVCFRVGNEEYGIEILKVQEILKLPIVTELPKVAEFIMGVIDLRGKILPIIDLKKRLGLELEITSKSTRAIVVNIKGKEVGLAIDSVSHVVRIDTKDIEPPPPIVKGVSGRYIIGIAKVKDDFVVILDLDKIFTSEEISILGK